MSTPYIYLCFYGEDRIVLWCLLKRQKSLQVCRNHILILSQFDQNHLKAYNINGTYFFRKNAIAMDQLAHEIGNFVSQKLSHIEGVKATSTQFVLKRYKEDGEVMPIELPKA